MTRFSSFLSGNLVELIYRYKLLKAVRRNFEEAQAERRHRLHASLVDGDHFCLRKALWGVVGEFNSRYVPTTRLWIFEDGNWRHKRWQNLLKQADMVVSDDVEKTRFLPGLWSLCTPDAVIEIRGEKYIWECKGMNDREFTKVKQTQVCPSRFVRRVHIYGAATGLMKAIIHIDNKSRADEFLVFVLDLNPELIYEMLRRVTSLEEAYQNYYSKKELPAPCGVKKCDCGELEFGIAEMRSSV